MLYITPGNLSKNKNFIMFSFTTVILSVTELIMLNAMSSIKLIGFIWVPVVIFDTLKVLNQKLKYLELILLNEDESLVLFSCCFIYFELFQLC